MELGGRYNNHSKYGDNFTYSFNPSYLIQNQFKLFFNLSTGFKAPSLYQLYGQFGSDDATNALVNLGIDLDTAESISQRACYHELGTKLNVQCDFEDSELENMRLERESF